MVHGSHTSKLAAMACSTTIMPYVEHDAPAGGARRKRQGPFPLPHMLSAVLPLVLGLLPLARKSKLLQQQPSFSLLPYVKEETVCPPRQPTALRLPPPARHKRSGPEPTARLGAQPPTRGHAAILLKGSTCCGGTSESYRKCCPTSPWTPCLEAALRNALSGGCAEKAATKLESWSTSLRVECSPPKKRTVASAKP